MLAKLAIPIVDQVPAITLEQNILIDIGDISYYLRYPTLMRIRCDSRNMNSAATKMKKEKDIVGNQTKAKSTLLW